MVAAELAARRSPPGARPPLRGDRRVHDQREVAQATIFVWVIKPCPATFEVGADSTDLEPVAFAGGGSDDPVE